jgi:type III secretion protein S
MTPIDILSLTREGLMVVLWVALPVVVVAAGTALVMAVFQTVTQIQDQSIGQSVTKIVVMVALLVLCGWQGRQVVGFAERAFQLVGELP